MQKLFETTILTLNEGKMQLIEELRQCGSDMLGFPSRVPEWKGKFEKLF